MFLKSTFVFLGLFVCSAFYANAQLVYLTGQSICADGLNQTEIAINDADPNLTYVLYRDGRRLVRLQNDTGLRPNYLKFGDYYESGVYTAAAFSSFSDDSSDPRLGIPVDGEIVIYPLPRILSEREVSRSLETGQTLNFVPRADMPDVEFSWTAVIEEGSLTNLPKNGRGPIENLTLELSDDQPAKVRFSITPRSPANRGGCFGNPVELTVNINPTANNNVNQ